MQKGLFISLEGLDGCGKTTQAKLLVEYFNSQRPKAMLTKEFSGSQLQDYIEAMNRSIVYQETLELDVSLNKNTNLSQFFAIMAIRHKYVESILKPCLTQGVVVVCDRFVDSTAAYQADDSLQMEDIYYMHQKFFPMPDHTFWIDTSIETINSRIHLRQTADPFDNMSQELRLKIRDKYLLICDKYPDRITRIEGNQDLKSIHRDIIDVLGKKFVEDCK